MDAMRSRARVERALDGLAEEFGVDRHVESRWRVGPDEYERVRERFEAGTVGGAGVWVRNDDGEVLLVKREGYDAWQEPSGKQEPGESLGEAAVREVREEAGVYCDLGRVALAQSVAFVEESSDRPPIHRLVVVFHGTYAGGTVRPRDGEIGDAGWFDERPENLLYDELADLPIPADS